MYPTSDSTFKKRPIRWTKMKFSICVAISMAIIVNLESVMGVYEDKDCKGVMDTRPGLCESSMPSFTYDAANKKCVRFTYTGCNTGRSKTRNRFNSEFDCKSRCILKQDPCVTIPDDSTGPFAVAAVYHYTYDKSQNKCIPFGGRRNYSNTWYNLDECTYRCVRIRRPSSRQAKRWRMGLE